MGNPAEILLGRYRWYRRLVGGTWHLIFSYRDGKYYWVRGGEYSDDSTYLYLVKTEKYGYSYRNGGTLDDGE